MRQPALRVDRAVDRVDHDPQVLAPEVDDATLLADRAEPRTRRVQCLELGEHDVLGRLVDQQGLVATLAARTGLPHALGDRRAVREHHRDLRRRPPAHSEPVGISGVGGHAGPILRRCQTR
jgi:hypothetical protein